MTIVPLRASPAVFCLSAAVAEWRTPDDARLTLSLCKPGTALSIPAGVLALVCPIAGSTDVICDEYRVRLHRADISTSDAQAHHDIVVSARGACIVIAGNLSGWSALTRLALSGAQPPLPLFPAVYRSVSASTRTLLRITRHSLTHCDGLNGVHGAHQLVRVLAELQSGFSAMIQRCPGSSISRKKAVFLRLQRVRNYMAACAHEELDIAQLALMANYSASHFITTFHSVFDETPYSAINRYRLANASALLSKSTLCIADIAEAIGFQSRSSFTRAIKKHLGSSASQFRAGEVCRHSDSENRMSATLATDPLCLAQS
jgi:AraC family transcriptional regulator